jgi:hypothetical protein
MVVGHEVVDGGYLIRANLRLEALGVATGRQRHRRPTVEPSQCRGGGYRDIADVARVMVSARVSDGTGRFKPHTIHLPISFSELSGSRVTPRVITQSSTGAV